MISEALKSTIERELSNDPPILTEGWLTPQRGFEMAELVLEVKPACIVEIGTFGGRSALCMGLALKELERGILYCIDPWKMDNALEGDIGMENKKWWTENVDLHGIHTGCMKTLWKHGLDPYVVVIRSASQWARDLFSSIDILNIDGNHSELASCRDVKIYVPKVRPGGYIWFDDANWDTTQKALLIMEDSCDLKLARHEYRLYQKRPQPQER